MMTTTTISKMASMIQNKKMSHVDAQIAICVAHMVSQKRQRWTISVGDSPIFWVVVR